MNHATSVLTVSITIKNKSRTDHTILKHNLQRFAAHIAHPFALEVSCKVKTINGEDHTVFVASVFMANELFFKFDDLVKEGQKLKNFAHPDDIIYFDVRGDFAFEVVQ